MLVVPPPLWGPDEGEPSICRYIELSNGLRALLISDLSQTGSKHTADGAEGAEGEEEEQREDGGHCGEEEEEEEEGVVDEGDKDTSEKKNKSSEKQVCLVFHSCSVDYGND